MNGVSTPDALHKKLGKILWEFCGMGRNEAGLKQALDEIPKIKDAYFQDIRIVGDNAGINQTLEKALRLEAFIDFAALG